MPDTTPAVWSDGDPLMEAVASAVWEQCNTEGPSAVVDDPRNIAAVAAKVARQLLGTTVAEGAAEPTPAELIRDSVAEWLKDCVWLTVDDEPMALAESWPTARALIDAIHTAAGLAAAPPAPVDRAATLRDAADFAETLRQFTPATGARKAAQVSENVGILRVSEALRYLADLPAAGVQQTTTADRAAALGMTPTEYRQHSHTTAVQQIQAAAKGLFAGTAIRVMDALEEPAAGVQPPTTTEAQHLGRKCACGHANRWHLPDCRDPKGQACDCLSFTPPAAPAAPENRP
ncbi:hypothetical protein ACWF2L_17610 [Streptomyces anulatus]